MTNIAGKSSHFLQSKNFLSFCRSGQEDRELFF